MANKVCFIGGTRYSQPLDTTSEKKFRTLTVLGDIYVIGFAQDIKPHRFTQHARFYLFPELPLAILRYLEMFLIGPFLALWVILRHRVRILVAQSPYEGFAAAWAKILARPFGKRAALIIESHGDFEVSLFLHRRVLLLAFYRLLMHRVARFALQHADVLRAVSNSTRQQLEAWAPGKPIIQFPAWTDIEVFLRAGDLNRQSKGERLILYVGVLTPLKGIHFLMDAFAEVAREVPEARLWIVGKAENSKYAEELKEQTRRLGLNEQVSFLGPVPQQKLAEYMARAEVLVLPSLSEGLPRVIFEAMVSKTSVIGTHVAGIPEMIKDGENGFLVPPGDAKALAEKLKWILDHPLEAQKMGRKAREFAKEFFSPEKYVQNYAQLFEEASQGLETYERGMG